MVATRHQRRMSLEEANFVINMACSDKVPRKWSWWFKELFYKAAAVIDYEYYHSNR